MAHFHSVARPTLIAVLLAIFDIGAALVNYECSDNEVLVVHSFGRGYLRMSCELLNVCQQNTVCEYFHNQANCGGHTYFTAGVKQGTIDDEVSHTCCAYQPDVLGHDENRCYIFSMKDKESFPGSDAISERLPAAGLDNGDFYLTLFRLRDRGAAELLIKQIRKTPNGYNVTICVPTCVPVWDVPDATTRAPSSRPDPPPTSGETQPAVETDRIPKFLGDEEVVEIVGCFSRETTVETPNGIKRMDNLRVGDRVLALDASGELTFQAVEMFYHREPQKSAEFISVLTEGNRTLTLTPSHLVPIVQCDTQLLQHHSLLQSSVFASRIQQGDCLLHKTDAETKAMRVQSVTRVVGRGVFSPMTSSGSIVVNGAVASCYSHFESHSINHLAFRALKHSRWVTDKLLDFTSSRSKPVPTFLRSMFDVAKLVFTGL